MTPNELMQEAENDTWIELFKLVLPGIVAKEGTPEELVDEASKIVLAAMNLMQTRRKGEES